MIFLFEISFNVVTLLQPVVLKKLGITYDKTGQNRIRSQATLYINSANYLNISIVRLFYERGQRNPHIFCNFINVGLFTGCGHYLRQINRPEIVCNNLQKST